MQNIFLHIDKPVKKVEIAFSRLLAFAYKFVLGEYFFKHLTATTLITFSSNSYQGTQRHGQSSTLTVMDFANNQQQNQQNSNWNSNREK